MNFYHIAPHGPRPDQPASRSGGWVDLSVWSACSHSIKSESPMTLHLQRIHFVSSLILIEGEVEILWTESLLVGELLKRSCRQQL